MATMLPEQELLAQLAQRIKDWGRELGFQQTAITDTDLGSAADLLKNWLASDYQGDMSWLAAHDDKRWRPEKLLPETSRIIIARMDYLPGNTQMVQTLRNPDKAYISRYALGRDYHKLIRKRLSQLANNIDEVWPGTVVHRPFVDSAPVMEKPLAEKAGLGWLGKNTLILHSEAGSWFFLGEIYINLPLPTDQPQQRNQCGNCTACLNICPTRAFPAPYVLDARRCISYLTIEHKGAIDEEFRPLMGNRVFGCDDCQAICPWNRYARVTREQDFSPRHKLADRDLAELFLWDATEFEHKTAGSPIRRIGFERWQRNLAVGLGNAATKSAAIHALNQRRGQVSAMVGEHIQWALQNLSTKKDSPRPNPKPFPEIDVVE